MSDVYDKPAFQNVGAVTARVLQHAPQVNLVERAILHPFQKMRAQLQFPRPPLRPLLRRQDSSDAVVLIVFSSAQRLPLTCGTLLFVTDRMISGHFLKRALRLVNCQDRHA